MAFLKYFLLVLLLSTALWLSAQTWRAEVQQFSTVEGLSHREVLAVFQDRDGFMWLGTRFGLNRFDGYAFRWWTQAQQGLNFNDISRIQQDDQGWLWLFNGDREFIFLQPKTGKIQRQAERFPGGLPFKTGLSDWCYDVQAQAGEASGRLHFVVFGRGAPRHFTYHTQEGFREVSSVGHAPSFPVDEQQRAFNARTGMVWQAGPEGWQIHAHDSDTVLLTLSRKDYPVNFFNPKCLYADRQGRMWLGGDFGVTVVDVQPARFQQYFSFARPAERPMNNSARGIWVDEQFLFVNFETGGFVRLPRHPNADQPAWTILDRSTDRPVKPNAPAYPYWGRPLWRDADSTFWIGSEYSLRHLSASGVLLEKFTFPAGTMSPNTASDFWAIHRATNGRMWLGYAQGLAYKDPGDRYLRRFDGLPGANDVPRIMVLDLLEDTASSGEGGLWLCTNRGLYWLDEKTNSAIRYSSRDTGMQYLPAENFQHLYRDEAGVYWLATAGNGLLRWDRRTGKVRAITRADGLSNDNIYAVYEDHRQRLWLSSDRGIMQLDKATLAVRTYLPKDGVAQEEFNRIAHFRAADGTIFFGGLNGVTAFHPDDFYANDPVESPPLRITSFQQFDQEKNELSDRTAALCESQTIVLQPGDRFFQLEFALLTYENVADIRYAWKLEGVDADWNYQRERSLRLSRLPYGRYVLHIKGQDAGGQWSAHELAITVWVLRPFYLRTWFFFLAGGVLLAGGYGAYRLRRRQLQRRRLLLARIEALLALHRQKEQAEALPRVAEVRAAATQQPMTPADRQWLDKLETVIRQHLTDAQFNTEFVAEKMAISRRQLQRRLQQLVGLPPSAYIQEIRLDEARRLLESRALDSVKAVALAVGYAHPEYFSRLFRERFGLPPSEYLG